jgi:hypothetical protein
MQVQVRQGGSSKEDHNCYQEEDHYNRYQENYSLSHKYLLHLLKQFTPLHQ